MKRWLYRTLVKTSYLLIFFTPCVAGATKNYWWFILSFIGALMLWWAAKLED